MPSLQQGRYRGHCVCTLDNKIFVFGGYNTTDCEVLDLSDDDPNWKYIDKMDSQHTEGGAVVVERNIFVLGGGTDIVEVYDVDQGIY